MGIKQDSLNLKAYFNTFPKLLFHSEKEGSEVTHRFHLIRIIFFVRSCKLNFRLMK